MDTKDSISNAVHWVLGNQNVFLNTTGDITLLATILKEAKDFKKRPSDQTMVSDAKKYNITSLFKGDEI